MSLRAYTLMLAVAGAAAVQPAQAAITVYTDKASFLAALSSTSLENFNDATLNPGLSITGDSVSFVNGRMVDIVNDNQRTSTTFSFATPINGFGGMFNLAVPGGPGTGITVTIDLMMGGLSVLAQEIPNTTNGFWGFVSDIAFDEVRFSEGSALALREKYRLDNLRYGVILPEPASMLLFGSGLLVAGAVRRYRLGRPTRA